MHRNAGAGTIVPDATDIRDIEDLWKHLFVADHNQVVARSAKALQAAVCGQNRALLCFGPRIECDSLLQVSRDIYAAMKPVYASSRALPFVHSFMEPGKVSFYVRPLPTVLPAWLADEGTVQPVLFAMLGPLEAVLEIATFLSKILDVKQ